MADKNLSVKKGLILVGFGVVLYQLLQNLNEATVVLGMMMGVFSPVILGLCIAFVMNVLMSACERPIQRMIPAQRPVLIRGCALVVTLIIVLGVIALTMMVIIPNLSKSLELFFTEIPRYVKFVSEELETLTQQTGGNREIMIDLRNALGNLAQQGIAYLKNEGTRIASVAIGLTSSVFGTVVDVVFGFIIAIYVLLDKEKIGGFIVRVMRHFLSERISAKTLELAKLAHNTFSAFVRGQCIEAVILGSMCFVGMVLFRFPHAMVVSVLIGVTALIPIVGAWIGCIISAFLVLLVNPVQAILLVIYILVLQQIEGNLIYPRVVGSTIGLPGVLVLVAVVVGQGLLGIFGALLFVPVTAVIYAVVRQTVDGKLPSDSVE